MSTLTLDPVTTDDPAGSVEDELLEQQLFSTPTAHITGPNISTLHCVTSRVEIPLLPHA